MIYFILIKKKKWNPFFNFEIINYYYESIGEGGCNFQSPKTNLITFTHYVTDPEFSLFTMNGCTHNEAFCVNRILVLKFTPDPQVEHIWSIVKDAEKMVSSLYYFKKYQRLLTKIMSGQKWNIVAISRLELPCLDRV